jgi:hypothetical protein
MLGLLPETTKENWHGSDRFSENDLQHRRRSAEREEQCGLIKADQRLY